MSGVGRQRQLGVTHFNVRFRPRADVPVRQLNVGNKHQSGRLTLDQIQNISFVTETPSVRAILEHIGEPTRPPVISPARAPPAWEEDPIAVDLGYEPLAQPEPEIECSRAANQTR